MRARTDPHRHANISIVTPETILNSVRELTLFQAPARLSPKGRRNFA